MEAAIDEYKLLERLSSTRQCEVFKCRRRSDGRVVDLKVVDLQAADLALDEVQQEVSVLAQSRCPQLPQLFSSRVVGRHLLLEVEHIGGGTLGEALESGPLPERAIAVVLRDVLKAVAYLHAAGYVHRDIKASNILLASDGSVKLADFGAVARLHSPTDRRHSFVGTLLWMAPEVMRQEPYSQAVDIWSLGITAIELAHAEPPHASQDPVHALYSIPRNPAPTLQGRFSRTFKDFVARCLQKAPGERPSAAHLLSHRLTAGAGTVALLQPLAQKNHQRRNARQREMYGPASRDPLALRAQLLASLSSRDLRHVAAPRWSLGSTVSDGVPDEVSAALESGGVAAGEVGKGDGGPYDEGDEDKDEEEEREEAAVGEALLGMWGSQLAPSLRVRAPESLVDAARRALAARDRPSGSPAHAAPLSQGEGEEDDDDRGRRMLDLLLRGPAGGSEGQGEGGTDALPADGEEGDREPVSVDPVRVWQEEVVSPAMEEALATASSRGLGDNAAASAVADLRASLLALARVDQGGAVLQCALSALVHRAQRHRLPWVRRAVAFPEAAMAECAAGKGQGHEAVLEASSAAARLLLNRYLREMDA